jgi:hypothetical protein
MPVRVGKDEAIIAITEFLGLGDESAASVFNFYGPTVSFGFAFGGEGEYDLVDGMGVGELAFHSGLQNIFFEEVDNQIVFAKKEANQVVGPTVELKPELGIKLGCAVQVGYGQVAPYLFWFHYLYRFVAKF